MSLIGFTAGTHPTVDGFCAMEWFASIMSDVKTDSPSCTWHGIAPAVWLVNDQITPDRGCRDPKPVDRVACRLFEQQILERLPRVVASRFDDQIDGLMRRLVLEDMFGVTVGGRLDSWLDDVPSAGWDGLSGNWPHLRALTNIFADADRRVSFKPKPDDHAGLVDLRLFSELDRVSSFDRDDPEIVAEVCAMSIMRGGQALPEHVRPGPMMLVERLGRLFDLFDLAARQVGLEERQQMEVERFAACLAASSWAGLRVSA